MTENSTVSGSSSSLGQTCVPIDHPTFRSLLITHTLLTLLIPLFIALFYYSTPHSRRQPIFILNVVVIGMAFSTGVLADVTGISLTLAPQRTVSPILWIASGIISILQSILVDLILFLRLISVYPLIRVGTRRFALISWFPILLKVVRLTNVSIFLGISIELVEKMGMGAIHAYFSLPFLKIEWVAQVVDNTYASVMFLRAIRVWVPPRRYLSDCSVVVQSTLPDRLRSLFRIALSNFVIPTLFSIAQLIIIFVAGGGLFVGDVVYVNGMLSVFGIVFASVWAGKESRRNLKEAKEFLHADNRDRNRPANDPLATGTYSTGPISLVVEAPELKDESRSQGLGRTLEGTKQSYLGVDLEAGSGIAQIPPAKLKSRITLSERTKSFGSATASTS